MKYLLAVGVLLLASVTPLYAQPAAMQPVNWFAPLCVAALVPRSGFLLPTLAVPETDAAPRLRVTKSAVRGAAPVRVSPALRQDRRSPKPPNNWIDRNWWWVVTVIAVPVGLVYLLRSFTA